MILLSERLEKIASLCEGCDVVVDIGCDHALIPVSLLERGKISYAIASDINKGPIEGARKNAERCGVEDKMRFVIADGLKGIDAKDDIFKDKDTALIISGMGGELIERIIKEAPAGVDFIREFIFSPHSKHEGFRRFLGDNGFHITGESFVREDGKYYFIIKAVRGADACQSDSDYELGPGFLESRDEIKGQYLHEKYRLFEGLCQNPAIRGEKREYNMSRLQIYERAIRRYEML